MIAILGAGSWGTALATVAAYNTKGKVYIWGRNINVINEINIQHRNNYYLPNIILPSNIVGCSDLKEILINSKNLLLAIPSHAFQDTIQAIKPYITKQHRIVFATKGLDSITGNFLHNTILSTLGQQQIFAVLSGPSFAAEVAQRLPTAITIASNEKNFTNDLIQYLHTDFFRVYTSSDYIGVQLGGIIKNIIAVAAGIADGLGFGANARAALITRGLAEMMRLGQALKAKTETLAGLSGVGDLILTCTDNQSRNKRFGLALTKGLSLDQAQKEIGHVVEAINNIKHVIALAKKYQVHLPITQCIEDILQNKITPLDAFQILMLRKPIQE